MNGVVRRDAHRSFRCVRDGQRDAPPLRDERDVAFTEPDRAGTVGGRGSERFAEHDEPRTLLQQDLEPDLRRDVGDPVHHVVRVERRAARARRRPRTTRRARAARCIASQTTAIASGALSFRPRARRASRELGRREDAEPIFLGGGQAHDGD